MEKETIQRFHDLAEELGVIEASYEMLYHIVQKHKGDYTTISKLMEVVYNECEKSNNKGLYQE